MNLFFDTSSLFKLYHSEQGTEEILNFFSNNKVGFIFLAEITRIEFSSVVWKKCRTKEIDETSAQTLISKFEIDSKKFKFVSESSDLRKQAKSLIEIHWKLGLRTLDSIQLASALSIRERIDCIFTSDKALSKIAIFEGLAVR